MSGPEYNPRDDEMDPEGYEQFLEESMRKEAEEMRQRCFKDMYRFIENCRRDSDHNVPAYETLTVMLQTLNDCGPEGFGDSDWQKKEAKK